MDEMNRIVEAQNHTIIQEIANLFQDSLLRNRLRAVHMLEDIIVKQKSLEKHSPILILALKNNDILIQKKILEVLLNNRPKLTPIFKEIIMPLIELFRSNNHEIYPLLTQLLNEIFEDEDIKTHCVLPAIQKMLEIRKEARRRKFSYHYSRNPTIDRTKIDKKHKHKLLRFLRIVIKKYSKFFDSTKNSSLTQPIEIDADEFKATNNFEYSPTKLEDLKPKKKNSEKTGHCDKLVKIGNRIIGYCPYCYKKVYTEDNICPNCNTPLIPN
jgi:hypothetical protein